MSGGVEVGVSARGVATILLNRPDRSNALDQRTLDELAQRFVSMGADDGVRIVDTLPVEHLSHGQALALASRKQTFSPFRRTIEHARPRGAARLF